MPHYVVRVNPTHHGHRRYRRRRNPSPAREPLLTTPIVVVGAITIGLAAFLLSRSSTAAPVPPPLPPPGGGGGGGGSPTPQPQTLDQRLQGSEQPREIYLFQAELYMYGYDSAQPDGILGPHTLSLVNRVNAETGFGFSTAWVPDMVRRGRIALQQQQQAETGSTTLGAAPFALTTTPSTTSLQMLQETQLLVDPDSTFTWAS